MPPIIEDYAAIKRRMDEIANPQKPRRYAYGGPSYGYYVAGNGDPELFVPTTESILTPEGRKLMEGK